MWRAAPTPRSPRSLRRSRRARAAVALGAFVAASGPALWRAPEAGAEPVSAEPRAWVVVDADTGRVVQGKDEHVPQGLYGLTKVLTAVMAVERLDPEALVAPGAAALAAPPRSMAGEAPTPMAQGQQWKVQDLIAGLMVESANDAAYTLAEATSKGDLGVWPGQARSTLQRFGTQDPVTLSDPAGIADATGAVPTMSPFDLAVVARNALGSPALVELMGLTSYQYQGPDNQLTTLATTNELLTDGTVEGVTGMKIGFTATASQSAIATATRDGRTMIAVFFDAYDPDGWAQELLTRGFDTAAAAQVGEELPAPALSLWVDRNAEREALEQLTTGTAADGTPIGSSTTVATTTTTTADGTASDTPRDSASDDGSGDSSGGAGSWLVPLLFVLLIAYVARVLQIRARKARRRANRRSRERMMRRGSLAVIEPPIEGPRGYSPQAASHVRLRRLDDPDDTDEPWDDWD